MARFLVTYHGGGMPDGEEARRQAMAAFGEWVGRVGDALVDPGAPLGPAVTVSNGGVASGAANGALGGYSILEADDLDAAAALVADHPYVARGGSLQVSTRSAVGAAEPGNPRAHVAPSTRRRFASTGEDDS